MKRIVFSQLLLVTLTACGSGAQPRADLPAFHSKATMRNCKTPIDLRGEAYAVAGIRGEIERYASTQRFSDDWIDVEWVVDGRALHARITNRTEAPMTIESVIVGPRKDRSANAAAQIGSRSSQRVALASVALMQKYLDGVGIGAASGATRAVPVELRIRIAEKECGYHFQLAAGAE